MTERNKYNVARPLYLKIQDTYEKNGSSNKSVEPEQVGFLKRPVVEGSDATAPANVALDMWVQLREARVELKKEYNKEA
jgi:hypothetical protein